MKNIMNGLKSKVLTKRALIIGGTAIGAAVVYGAAKAFLGNDEELEEVETEFEDEHSGRYDWNEDSTDSIIEE